MPTYHVLCRDCPYESTHGERYIAAFGAPVNVGGQLNVGGEAHDVEYEEVA